MQYSVTLAISVHDSTNFCLMFEGKTYKETPQPLVIC